MKTTPRTPSTPLRRAELHEISGGRTLIPSESYGLPRLLPPIRWPKPHGPAPTWTDGFRLPQ